MCILCQIDPTSNVENNHEHVKVITNHVEARMNSALQNSGLSARVKFIMDETDPLGYRMDIKGPETETREKVEVVIKRVMLVYNADISTTIQ